jgi:hypothetical protein
MNRLTLGAAVTAMVLLAAPATAAKPERTDFEFEDFGFFIGDCGDFIVLNDSYIRGFFVEHFNNDGSLKFVFQRLQLSDSIYYREDDRSVYLTGGPGEVEVTKFFDADDPPTFVVTGIPFKVTVPGQGIIFHDSGRIIIDTTTGNVLFQAGPKDFGDDQLGGLCEALRQ